MVDRQKKNPSLSWAAALVLLAALLATKGGWAATPLSPKHKKWLEEEVVYIISDDERKLFLSLSTDADRDLFIEQFWELRDPTPGTPENEYKEEHYRRIEHANMYFGFDVGKEGWRSDRGRIYIQLGEPAQRFRFTAHGEVRPIELWFYAQSDHPSLPNAFNVMFFQPDTATGFRLYSPTMDGPDKLVTRTGAENDPLGSYRFLRNINPEIARASMTLLTDEPVDTEGRGPSLASDSLLTRIRNLPNDKFTREALDRRRQLKEVVKVRRVYEPAQMEVLAVPLRDLSGEPYVHFLLSLSDPLKNMVAEAGKEKELTATVSVLVQMPDGGEKVFQQVHTNRYVFKDDYDWKQDWPVSYEDRLPLAPGDYDLDFVFRNEATQAFFTQHVRLEVPLLAAKGLGLSPLVAYEEAYPGKPDQTPLPFQFADLKFAPTERRKFTSSEKLSVFFQIEDSPTGGGAKATDVLEIEYTLGSLSSGGPRQTMTQEISKRDLTSYGTVFHGKSFSLGDFSSGSYRLAVKVTDPETHQTASRTLSFQIVPGAVESRRVRLVNALADKDLQAGWLDYRRGVSELAQGRVEKGIGHLQDALRLNPALKEARNRLADLYYQRGEFDLVASLYPAEGLVRTTDLGGVRRFVSSFERIGQPEKAIEIAERALASLGPQPLLYEDLARLYTLMGQTTQAEKMREEARQLDRRRAQKTKNED